MLDRMKLRLRALFRRGAMEADLDEELSYHLEKDVQRHIARGMSPADARLAVRRGFGNVEVLKEESRDARGIHWLEDLVQDVRYVVRTLRRSPGFATAAVLTLALGIGMTTAIFSIVHGVLMRPLPFDDPERLVTVRTIIEDEGDSHPYVSPPNFVSLQEEDSRSVAELGAYVPMSPVLVGGGEARRLEAARVSVGFFELAGVQPLLGRTFHREENQPGAHEVVVLAYALWQRQFGGDAGVIGRTIVLDERPHTVIGVMPRHFDFPDDCALWTPQPYEGDWSATTTEGRYRQESVQVLARLRPGTSVEAARAELRVLGRRLEERFPDTNLGVSFTARPFHEDLVDDVRPPLLYLFGAVGSVFFIACANVAGLLLVRAVSRREEVAVRTALGARRGRIVRQLVTESIVLGVGGGVLGLALAFWATSALVGALSHTIMPRLAAVRVDGTVLAFAFAAMLLAGVVAGLVPAIRAAAEGLAGTLQSGGRSGLASQRGQRLRSGLVVAQLAMAVVLVAGAGVLFHSFVRLASVDPGFRTGGILSFGLNLPEGRYGSPEQVREFFSRLLERVEGQPGVRSAGAISRLPIGQRGAGRIIFRAEGQAPDRNEETWIGVRTVSPEYFQTMGVPILRGRGLTERDRAGSPPTVVINEAAVEQFFPGKDPIGRRLAEFQDERIKDASDAFTIVGVVGNVRSRGLNREPQAEVYFAHAQVPLGSMAVVVRTAGDPLGLTGAIRRELRSLDPNLPVPELRSLDQVVADSLAGSRLMTSLLSLFSAVALTLAAVGIFALLSFAVARRTREIGIRIALGASPSALVGTVVREALALLVMGLAIGIWGALAFTRILESQLSACAACQRVNATDPMAFAGVGLVLGVTALLASLVPAWRAARVDPLVALRAE